MGDGVILVDPQGGPAKLVLRQLIGRIEAEPEHHSVVKGSKIKYRFALEARETEAQFYWDGQPEPAPTTNPAREQFDKTGRTEHPIPQEIVDKLPEKPTVKDIAPMLSWMLIYDRSRGGDTPPFDLVARSGHEVEITWKYPGTHVLLVRIAWFHESPTKSPRDQAHTHIMFTQRVSDVQTVQRQRMKVARGKPAPHPLEELEAMERYVQAIEDAERQHGVPKDKEKKYRADLEQKRKYRDALDDMFGHYRNPRFGHMLIPAIATYAAKDSNEQGDLRICLDERWGIKDNQTYVEVTLIDWTNPLESRLKGRYSGSGPDRVAAIQEAVAEWKANCQYYHPGSVVGEIPSLHFVRNEAPPPPVPFSFNTPGKSFWDHLKEFLEALGLVVASLAFVITLITPIPGDEIIVGLIWTAIFTSITASAIGIGTRKRNGFGNGGDDAFDILTIVGSVFTAGQLGWARRAMLVSKAFGGQFKQFCLFGEVASDAIQGVLIAKEKIADFEKILSDPSLSPTERVDKMLELVRSAAISGAMHYSSIRGSKKPARHGERPETFIDAPTLKRLENPREVIDLDTLKKQKADAADGQLKTKVQDEPERAKPKPKADPKPRPPGPAKRRKFDFKEAPPPEKRGLRQEDDFDFSQQALDRDKIILVRDSNAAAVKHVSDPAKGPKPESLKAKSLKDTPPPTLRKPENAGLAAAHPDDPRLKELMAEMKSPKTGKPPISYDEFVAELNKQGYRVSGPDNDYVVVSNTAAKGYYSDYDLHGVYDRKGNDAYTEKFRDELNARFGKELVQHGPHDKWPKRNTKEAGPNRGPQPPVTAYVPHNGKVRKYHLDTKDEMQAFYEAWGIPWKKIYPPL